MAKDKLIQIVDRVNRMDKIIWSEMLSIRNDDLKQHTEAQLEKLEQSLIHNGFIEPFAAWQDPKTQEIYTINGHTRKKRLLALIEKGYSIPEKLSAFFIDCKNLNDAASVLPLYESKYGNLDASKLDEFKITFELDETKVVGSTLDFFNLSGFDTLVNGDDFGDTFSLPSGDKSPIQQITFTLSNIQAEEIKNAITEIKKTDDYKNLDTSLNDNSNGNAVHLIILKWMQGIK